MIDPVIAEDDILYERREIERWFKENAPTLISPITGIKINSQKLLPNRAIKDFIEERGLNNPSGQSTLPDTNSVLTRDMISTRLIHSFRWLTKNKFNSIQVNVFLNRFGYLYYYWWWPSVYSRVEFTRTAWDACPEWRQKIYNAFAEAILGTNETPHQLKIHAKDFYLQSIIDNWNDTRTEQLFKALKNYETTISHTNYTPEYRALYYNQWLEYWGEQHPPPQPPPQPQPPRQYPHTSGRSDSADFWRWRWDL